MINGFEDQDFLIKLTVDKSEAFIGLEEFDIEIEIQNKSVQKKSFEIDFSCSSDLILLDDERKQISLNKNQKTNISIHAKFAPNTNPLDLKAEPEFFSNHYAESILY